MNLPVIEPRSFIPDANVRPGKAPGEYPSGGPLPHLIDIWKAAAPALDMLSPDIYFRNFTSIAADYDRPDNPLFIPEQGRATVDELMANAFFAIGEHKAIGYSPFDIDDFNGNRAGRCSKPLES